MSSLALPSITPAASLFCCRHFSVRFEKEASRIEEAVSFCFKSMQEDDADNDAEDDELKDDNDDDGDEYVLSCCGDVNVL